jgi:hypothetical protein
MQGLVQHLAEVEPVEDPEALADQLTLILEGMNASVKALGVDGPAKRARAMAEVLLDAATGGSARRPVEATRSDTRATAARPAAARQRRKPPNDAR